MYSNPKLILSALGIASMALGTATATADSIGSPRQTNSQTNTTIQSGSQTTGDGTQLGDVTQSGFNSNSSELGNSQSRTGLLVLGDTAQNNRQIDGNAQFIRQDAANGHPVLGATTQTQSNRYATRAINTQTII